MPLEKSIVARIIKRANQRPRTYARKIHGSGYSSGWPDIIICQFGLLLMVEAKQPGKKATPLQAAELAKWEAAGARAMVATSWEEVLDALEAMAEGY